MNIVLPTDSCLCAQCLHINTFLDQKGCPYNRQSFGLRYNGKHMEKKKTVVIVPTNDAEAMLIAQLAEKKGFDVLRSKQSHGASLDHGRDYMEVIKKGEWQRVIVVEMPGVKTEERLRSLGCEIVIIDHHNYTGLERAFFPGSRRTLPSSLEQFLRVARITDCQLEEWGFSPKLVKGVGLFDRGFIWALQKEGYTKKEIREVLRYEEELMGERKPLSEDKKRLEAVEEAWKNHKKWQEFFLVENESVYLLRGALSIFLALKRGKPTPLILWEKQHHRFYVQETKWAQVLYKHFGGFTYGTQQNWGYRNDQERKKLYFEDILEFLESRGKKK